MDYEMSDIEILEDLLKQKYDNQLLNTLSKMNEKDEVYILTIFEREAIENLIKENKELKDTNKKLYELCKNKSMQEFINNECGFISKSKVREKIEKIEEIFNEMDELDEEGFDEDIVNYKRNLQDTIIVLKELLEEGE